ncbi:DUF6801 domain-containing protein [Kitasatospora sp. NPDC088391]|uniref:DUF6801 domain-containing protein n=1 Tax=Kitasatospora sp. NPDC088391 TaxID=3364074 RepID=UPI003815DD38
MSAAPRTHRPPGRTRRAAVAATATALVGTLGAAPAAARPAAPTLRYTCVFPTIGGQAVTAVISADIPAALPAGESSPAFGIRAAATVEASFTLGLRYVLGVRSIEGSVDADTRVLAPQGETAVPVHLAITPTPVPAAGAFEIPATGNAPRLSFTRPGTGRVTAGSFVLHLVPKDADGNLAGPGRVDVPCTLNAGQDSTVAPFEVTPAKAVPAPPTGAPAPSSATPADTPSGTGAPAAASSAPADGTPPAPAPPSAAPDPTATGTTVPGTPAATGPTDARPVSAGRAPVAGPLLAALAGALVAAVAAAAVLHLRSRRRRAPRPPA